MLFQVPGPPVSATTDVKAPQARFATQLHDAAVAVQICGSRLDPFPCLPCRHSAAFGTALSRPTNSNTAHKRGGSRYRDTATAGPVSHATRASPSAHLGKSPFAASLIRRLFSRFAADFRRVFESQPLSASIQDELPRRARVPGPTTAHTRAPPQIVCRGRPDKDEICII